VIWAHLICTNFIILRLNTQQVLAQHIPHLSYTLLPSPFSFRVDLRHLSLVVLQYRSRTAGCSVFSPHYKLRTRLNTMLFAGAFSPLQVTDREYLTE